MSETKVIVFGYDELLLASLEFLSGVNADVAAVVFPSNRTDARANAVRKDVAAAGHTILEQSPAGKDDAFCTELESLAPDLILVWSYPMILPQRVIDIPRLGAVNLHLGLLPQYRGVNGIRWALLNGETETGLTLHYMDAGIDTGPMIARLSFPIGPEDDILLLMRRSRTAGLALLTNSWEHIASGTAVTMPQDPTKAGYYSAMMAPSDIIDWTLPSSRIHNLIRASAFPFPGVHTFLDGRKITLRRSIPLPNDPAKAAPGTIISVDDGGFIVATGDGMLRITSIEIDGKAVENQHLEGHGIVPGIGFTG